MKIKLSLLVVFFTFFQPCMSFQKVIIWGHKLHSHTHSYIHYAFFKAFRHLGYETYWFDDDHNISAEFDFNKALFITEGQVDKNIPIRDDCFYVLHNCHSNKYDILHEKQQTIAIQTYKHTAKTAYPQAQELEPCILYDIENRTLHLPWATDLLPDEIDQVKHKMKSGIQREQTVYWVGTIGGNLYGNIDQINPFKQACEEQNIVFVHKNPWSQAVSCYENKCLTQISYIAPAIVGKWQKDNGYIPCRIFKNISYGHFGVTNSKDVYDLFEGTIVYNPNEYQLFYDAQEFIKNASFEDLERQMDFVRDHHTYINRIHSILHFIELCQAKAYPVHQQ